MDQSSDDQSPRSRPAYSRANHRSRSHDSAHSEEAALPAAKSWNHPLIPDGDAALVTTQEQLSELIESLRAGGSFAYDSEFIGELTYIPKLCLIQVASAKEIALTDPLAAIDLTPFWELLCDPSVEKIVHAGQQDIEPVIRNIGREPQNVFDTQIAAGFVGIPYPVALSKLVFELIGARLGKGLTFTHWDQRPLSAMQLRYAADDVRFLPAIRAKLGERLAQTGHTEWAAQESAALCDASLYGFNPDTQYLRVRGAGSLPPRNLAVLRELTIWRDSAARAHNVPPRAFLRDEIMVDLARSPVKAVEKLARVRGLPRPIEHAHGAQIVDATTRALAMPTTNLPVPREVEATPTERFTGDALWAAVQCLCAGRSLDPSLVTNRQEVGDFYRQFISNGNMDDLPLLKSWRRAAVGEPLIAFVKGESRLSVGWSDGKLKAAAQ